MEFSEGKAETFIGGRARGWLWNPERDVVVTRVVGHVELDALAWYTERIDRQLARHKPIHVFQDWSQISGFDPGIRTPYRAWAASKANQVFPQYFVESKVIAMAISVTALVLGQKLEVHTNERLFSRALSERLGRTRHARVSAPPGSVPESLPPPPHASGRRSKPRDDAER